MDQPDAAAAIGEAETLIGPGAPLRQAAALALTDAVYQQHLGNYEQAVASGLRQAEFYRQGGHEWGVQLALINVAFYECGLDRFDAAIDRLRAVIDKLRQMGAPYGISHATLILACAHAMRGDREAALANARATVPYLQRGGDPAGMLLTIALVHARHGEPARAASLLSYVDGDFRRAGRIFFPMLTRLRDEIVSRALAALGPAEFDRQSAAGASLSEEAALALAFDDPGIPDRRTPLVAGRRR